jgi:hypothetical protein
MGPGELWEALLRYKEGLSVIEQAREDRGRWRRDVAQLEKGHRGSLRKGERWGREEGLSTLFALLQNAGPRIPTVCEVEAFGSPNANLERSAWWGRWIPNPG